MGTKKYQLKKEFASKWIEALRSGKYEQGHNAYVQGENCYCALGVGHVVEGCTASQYSNDWMLDGFSPLVPSYGDLYKEIIKCNDIMLLSLPEIADWIETNVEFI